MPTYKRAVGTGEALAEKGHWVYILAQATKENRERLKREAPHCRPVFYCGKSLFHEIACKVTTIWRIQPDVVYSNSYSPRNLAFLSWLLPRKVCRVLEFCELYSAYGKTQSLWKVKERIALRENDCILCASSYLHEYFSGLVKRMGIVRQMIYSPYAYPEYLKPEPHQNHKRKTIVFMAALFANYGVYEVVEACEMLIRQGKDLELEVIGGGPEKKTARDRVVRDGMEDRVHIRGFVPEEYLNSYFSRADIFISPLHDTVQDRARCPSKIFYYIPYNKPIVTCALGDPLETLGEYGFYYKPDDIVDMSRVIGEALSASEEFTFPEGFIMRHSWRARADSLLGLVKGRS